MMIDKFRHFIEKTNWDDEVIRQDEAARPVLIGIAVSAALILAWSCSAAIFRLLIGLVGGFP